MASIRKRGSKYEVQIRRVNCKSVTKSFIRLSDAKRWARMMEVKADCHDLPISQADLNQYKLKDIIERYRDEVSVKKKSYNTEVYILNAFLRTDLAKLRLIQLTPSDFGLYRENRLKSVKAGTVNRELGIIQHALSIARDEWGIPLKENPLDRLKKLKVNNMRDRRLKAGELEKIIVSSQATKNPYVLSIILFAIETAMRRGEILNIEREHIDFDSRTLKIPVTKNGYSRTIPLTNKAIEILKSTPSQVDKVFPVSGNALRLSWGRIIKRSGIQDLHFHDLRHEAVSRFFEMNLSIAEVSLISGHRDARMLFRYTHLRPQEIANKLNSNENKKYHV